MNKKLVKNWPLMLMVAALASVSISSLAMATCDAIMSGDGGDGDWSVNSQKGETEPVPSGLEDSDWIWLDDIFAVGSNQFTRTFEIDGTPTSGTLLIACDDYYYDLTLNGIYIGENRNVGGWLTADVYDVTPYLHNGINTLTVTAENDVWNWGGLSYKLDFCWNDVSSCPVAEDDEYGAIYGKNMVVAADNGVLQNDDDIDGDDLTTELSIGPSHGTLSLNADGSFSYRPALGFLGMDSFTYKAFDGKCYSDPAIATIQVAKCPWFIKNELYSALCGVDKAVPASEGILANDPGVTAIVNPETITIDPIYGSIEVEEDGSFMYYAAENIASGTYVQFKYTATNGVCEAKYQGIAKIQISCRC